VAEGYLQEIPSDHPGRILSSFERIFAMSFDLSFWALRSITIGPQTEGDAGMDPKMIGNAYHENRKVNSKNKEHSFDQEKKEM
jgi:hypothetical protein